MGSLFDAFCNAIERTGREMAKITEGKITLLLTLGPTSPLSPLPPVGPGGPCFDRKSIYRKMNLYSFLKF